jgi:ribosomal protein L22
MADRAGGKAGDAGTKIDQPSDQEGKGTPDKEALETTESAEAVGQEQAAEKAQAPTPKPRKPKTEPKAEDTATAETKVDKEAADEAAKAEAPKAAAASKPARTRREPANGAPVVRAQAKYVRTSARKARLVCDNIRGKSVDEARAILAFTPRAVAKDWAKLLNSAVANAEHNHELLGDDLKIAAAYADEGPTLKRFQPRAMGRATRIRKRTAHLTITLTPKE